MMHTYTVKLFFILCLFVTFTSFASAEVDPCQKEGNGFMRGLQGKSFMVTFSLDEEEYTDVFTFGLDGSFTMAFFSEIENSSGFYLDLLGILFLARFSGSFPSNPFSFNFYGIYLSPDIFGRTIISFGDSRYRGKFSGTED